MPEVNMDSAKLAETALSLCSTAPHDFGGIVFKNASETHTSHIRNLFKSGEIDATVLQPFYTLKDLTGGIDAISTMSSGKLVKQPGLLEKPGWFIQVMGERLPLENQAVMCKRIDEKKIGPVLVLDESQQDEPNALHKISDRLAFQVDLINVRYCDFKPAKPLTPASNTFRAKLTNYQQKALVLSAIKLGIYSIRPVLMAQKAAQILSSINGREEVSNGDLEPVSYTHLTLPTKA